MTSFLTLNMAMNYKPSYEIWKQIICLWKKNYEEEYD